MTKHLDVGARKSIWDLYRSSRPDGTKPSLKDVAAVLGYSKNQVRLAVQKGRAGKGFSEGGGRGRKRSTTAQEDRLMVRQLKVDAFKSSTAVRAAVFPRGTAAYKAVSQQLIRRRFHESGLSCRRAAPKPFLTSVEMKCRLAWAKRRKGMPWNLVCGILPAKTQIIPCLVGRSFFPTKSDFSCTRTASSECGVHAAADLTSDLFKERRNLVAEV